MTIEKVYCLENITVDRIRICQLNTLGVVFLVFASPFNFEILNGTLSSRSETSIQPLNVIHQKLTCKACKFCVNCSVVLAPMSKH
jgi:hypothetical protein